MTGAEEEPPGESGAEAIDSNQGSRRTLSGVDDEPPRPPAGYEWPVLYETQHYPYNPYALDIALFALAVVVFFLFGQAIGDPSVLFDPASYPVSLTIGATIGTFVLHEGIHAVLGKSVGCSVSIGMRGFSLWTSLTNAFQSRPQTVMIALGPTAIITPVYAGLLVFGPPMLAAAALVGLFVNTVGLRHDLTLVYRMWELPSGALLFNTDEHSFVYRTDRAADKEQH